jgi:N-acetylneuraminic acid mutarotase
MTKRSVLLAMAMPVLALGASRIGCAAEDTHASTLRARFPEHARRILEGGEPFAAAPGGFSLAAQSTARAPDRALSLVLPEDAGGEARFSLADGFSVRVVEERALGEGRLEGGAVVYRRTGGASFWAATKAGFEEWLLVNAPGKLVARYRIEGARLFKNGDAVDLLDSSNVRRVTVSAREAFAPDGRRVSVRLEVDEERRLLVLCEEPTRPLLVDPSWASAQGSPRSEHTATLLPNGKVLLAGGTDSPATGEPIERLELFDPTTFKVTTLVAVMRPARRLHTATLLPTGKVLLAGGIQSLGVTTTRADLFDPASETLAAAGSMQEMRQSHTATLLPNGKVLVTGGGTSGLGSDSAEIYDPTTNTWTKTGVMATLRTDHTATLLPSGKVLVTGKRYGIQNVPSEIYDPATGLFTSTGTSLAIRNGHTATLLPDGKVLIAGGWTGKSSIPTSLASCEFFDPLQGTFTTAPWMSQARAFHTATLLPSGGLLVTGGTDQSPLKAAEIYDFTTASWKSETPLYARYNHTATLLPSGRLLLFGGEGQNGVVNSQAELFDTSTGRASALGGTGMTEARRSASATLLPSGDVLIAGGTNATNVALTSVETYNPSTGLYTTATGRLSEGRYEHTATLLLDGSVLLAGGTSPMGTVANSGEVFDPSTGAVTLKAAMSTARRGHTATLLPSGKVLMAGGDKASMPVAVTNSAELFDPATRSWSMTGALNDDRAYHSATLLSNGKVLVAGGRGTLAPRSSAEVYDPATGRWAATGSMRTGRERHAASLLPDGRVFISGGKDESGAVRRDSEVYDPATGVFGFMGSMSVTRHKHLSTVLPSGKVLVVGGLSSGTSIVATAETFDPATGSWAGVWTSTGSTTARASPAAAVLAGGKLWVGGGNSATGTTLASADIFEESLGAAPAWTPVLSPFSGGAIPGSTIPLAGSLFTGVSESSGGLQNASATNFPLLVLQRIDNQALLVALVRDWTPTSATASIPTSAHFGWYLARVVVNGVGSPPQSLLISAPSGKLGSACASAGVCASGFCADGVCCDSACAGGACDTCNSPAKAGTCTPLPGPCDDGNPCTHKDACASGACNGTTYTCVAGPCQTTSICSGNGSCLVTAKADGDACNDGNPCTTSDACRTGQCKGTAYVCTSTECLSSTCDGRGTCTLSPRPNGAPCSGGLCASGACAFYDGGVLPADAGSGVDAGFPQFVDVGFVGPDGGDVGYDATPFGGDVGVPGPDGSLPDLDGGSADAGTSPGSDATGSSDAGKPPPPGSLYAAIGCSIGQGPSAGMLGGVLAGLVLLRRRRKRAELPSGNRSER